ncbi:YbhB/YbcL family Raf kinase inhibitor-like protein [Sulfurimonas sp. HSL-1716]|uniref:YbhB/YbcL family Raf kinase inhibitor-like protein n=1 Tax=Hydrocurvibacter sulfurireducens TaxID=3131937 RepID=UPI0031F88D7D
MRFLVFVLFSLGIACAGNFTLTSDLGGQLTKKEEFNGFGCNGQNKSPALKWRGAPAGTKSFAVTIYDPDAPTGSGWWHWIVYNIPKSVTSVVENASALGLLPKLAVESTTSYGIGGFGGACPPKGDKPHRYVITVYALDVAKLDLPTNASPALVGFNLNAHAIQKSSIISYYGR